MPSHSGASPTPLNRFSMRHKRRKYRSKRSNNFSYLSSFPALPSKSWHKYHNKTNFKKYRIFLPETIFLLLYFVTFVLSWSNTYDFHSLRIFHLKNFISWKNCKPSIQLQCILVKNTSVNKKNDTRKSYSMSYTCTNSKRFIYHSESCGKRKHPNFSSQE